ncbi:MAG TPA: signal recognition particle protein [Polyangiaceae bacterium]|nr:signal recognition particle protein [Polyangiaceae bacterium]
MFDTLAKGFKAARNRLAGLTELTEQNIDTALREVRLSLLEADVELGVVKSFLARVKDKALGEVVRTRAKGQDGGAVRVSASDVFVKICHDELVAFMAPGDGPPVAMAPKGQPTGIMMVGLQGSGKTTTTAKLARWLDKQGHRPLLVAADMQRPAAVEQLKILGEQIGVPVFTLAGATPLEICTQALAQARAGKHDMVVYDTAGRLAIDEPLMKELSDIKSAVEPQNILLVVDAMIGQDAVKTSKTFHDRLGITGVVLTKLDGDARGGAALSVREVTGAPVRFAGVGETLDKFEEFRAEGMASRVLGMGDVVGLMKDFQEVVDEKEAAEKAMRMLEGQFSLDDFLEQIRMIQKMGSIKDLIAKMPGVGDMLPADASIDDHELVRIEAIIQSFTKFERRDPYALIREPSRVTRIANGSGQPDKQVQELVQKFLFMKQMMEGIGANMGMLGRVPGMKNVAMAKQLRKQMAGGAMPGMGLPGFPGMPGLGGFPGMPAMGGFPGMPGAMAPGGGGSGESMTRMRPLSTAEKNARKAARKREKDARRKSRR